MNARAANDLVRHVESSLVTRCRLRDRQRILLAVSGGLDSVVLLHIFRALAPLHRWDLVVAHFNHQLRGRASDGDERFVRSLAKNAGLPFVAGNWPEEERAPIRTFGLEMAARLRRHRFLGQAAGAARCPTIALAHHADDQLELFLLRLFRGAGGGGLGGMKWTTPGWAGGGARLLRPLLDVSRHELADFAQKQGLRHREDASNRVLDRDRNWVRHELLPRVEQRLGTGPRRTLPRTMDLLATEADFAERAAERWLKAVSREPYSRLHPAVQRHVIRLQLRQQGVNADFEQVERLRLNARQPLAMDGGQRWCRGQDGLILPDKSIPTPFASSAVEIQLSPSGGHIFDGVALQWRLRRGTPASRRPSRRVAGVEQFDAARVGEVIRVRHWRPGDRFEPIGLGGSIKLQDLFTNLKIPAARRRALLVAEAADGRIFWVEGARIGDPFKLTARTRCMLEWRWQRRL